MSNLNFKKIFYKKVTSYLIDSYFHDMYAMQLALLKHWYQEHSVF